MAVYALGDLVPEIDPGAWIHPEAVIIGNVSVADEASIWPTAVLRGDFGRIEVGPRSSVQDGTVVHAGMDYPTVIGRECVIGHNAYLEGCTIEDEALVGSMASILPRSVLGKGCIIGAGAVVMERTEVPAGALAVGVPAEVREGEVAEGRWSVGVQRYVDLAARYGREMRRID
jgi:carbonic anhydrase/acetyltransferase-like protein (isoleucine patch superfamily)